MSNKDESPKPIDAVELAKELVKNLRGIRADSPQEPKLKYKEMQVLPQNIAKALVDAGNFAWRINTKITDTETGEPKEELTKEDIKKLSRYLESMMESLTSVGMKIKDRTGEIFDYGLPENVISAQTQPGLIKETIIETIKPTIYWNDKVIQAGDVVIATPLEKKVEEKQP